MNKKLNEMEKITKEQFEAYVDVQVIIDGQRYKII